MTQPKRGHDDRPVGLQCPDCGCRHFYAVYTRPTPNRRIIRRRQPRHCGRRITTAEKTGG